MTATETLRSANYVYLPKALGSSAEKPENLYTAKVYHKPAAIASPLLR